MISSQKPCKQEEIGLKYLKCWGKKNTCLEFCTLQNYSSKSEGEILSHTNKKLKFVISRCASVINVKRTFSERRKIV